MVPSIQSHNIKSVLNDEKCLGDHWQVELKLYHWKGCGGGILWI